MDSNLIIYLYYYLKSNSVLLHFYSCCIVITIRSVRSENTACTKVVNLFARNVRIALIITTKKLDLGDLVQEVVCISLVMSSAAHRFGLVEFWIFVVVFYRQAQWKKSKQVPVFKIWRFQIHELLRTLLLRAVLL